MKILVLGHSGFLGEKFLDFLEENYKGTDVVGISDSYSGSKYKKINLKEYKGFDEASEMNDNFDFVFNFVHSQRSKNVCKAERELAEVITGFILKNNIEAPLIMLRSVGKGSDHIRSRIEFDEILKKRLKNKIVEIRVSIIEEEGSVSYEIPFRVLKRTKYLPRFPWMANEVSLVKIADLYNVFERIINGKEKRKIITPGHRTMTYEDYIKEIAYEEGFPVEFINIPYNDFSVTPFVVKLLTGLDYYIVRNLMRTLKNDSVL